ncbi:MAG: Gfo/Idh/MocA family oxidoreductase [Selenomonadaceae bacterium]|nr:Gfo/Idh/MocA family oxidoreductase [Selenomonadaceae bacterium]
MDRTITVAIVGAGQLGSRHLQVLALTELPLSIEVMDVSTESLAMSESRWHEMPTNPLVSGIKFVGSIDELSPELDVVVVATGSKARLAVVKQLLETKRVKYMVLEKFLFPRLSDFDEAQRLIEASGTKVWVNCGRRQMKFYNVMRELFRGEKCFAMSVSGANWGLGCNAIHFLDLYAFLSDQKIFESDIEYLDADRIDSKRKGYIEFTGSLRVKSPKGALLLTSYAPSLFDSRTGGGYASVIILNSEHLYCVVEESKGQAKLLRRHDDGWHWDEFEIDGKMQSRVTQELVAQMIGSGDLDLPTFEESAALHKVLLAGFLRQMNSFGEERVELCPIT